MVTLLMRSGYCSGSLQRLLPAFGLLSALLLGDVGPVFAQGLSATKLMERGKQRRERGDHVGAIIDFSGAFEKNPQLLEALVERATSKWALSLPYFAGYDLKLAIALNPEFGPALLKRAEICSSVKFENRDEGELNATAAIAAGIPQGHSFRAAIRRRMGLVDEAIEDYTEYLKAAPKDTYANVNRGYSRMLLGDYPAAIEDISLDFSAPPPHPSGYFWRGIAYALSGERESAELDFAKQLEVFPEDGDYINNGKQVLDLLLQEPQPETADEFIARAVKLNEMGDSQFAIADLNRAIIVDESSVAAYTTLGQILSEQQFYDHSAQAYAKASSLADGDANLLGKAALAYYTGNRYEQGLETCAAGLEIDSRHGSLTNLKGLCLYALGRYQEAAVEHLACTEFMANDVVVLANLADDYLDLGEIDRAVGHYNRAITLRPEYVYALRMRALCHRILGDYDAARADINAAMQAASTPDVYNLVLMAQIELAAEQPDEAITLLKQAIEADGRYSDAFRWMAVAEDMRGNTKEAMKAIDTALQWYVGSATIHGTRALLRLKNGDKDGAERDLKYAALMEPRLEPVVSLWPERLEQDGLIGTILRPAKIIRAGESPAKPVMTPEVVDYPAEPAPAPVAAEEAPAVRKTPRLKTPVVAKKAFDSALENFEAMEFDLAIKGFSKAIKLFPAYAEAYLYRGLAYQKVGKTTEAEKDLQTAVERDPELQSKLDELSQ